MRALILLIGGLWVCSHSIFAVDWDVTMNHGINYGYDAFKSPDLFWEHLDEAKSLNDKIWIATFCQVASYIKA